MSKVTFKAMAREFKNGCLLLPATPADKRILDNFCRSIGTKYATVTANFSRGNKTYDQVKTVFALAAIIFEMNYDRRPNQDETQAVYESLLEDYAERIPDVLHPERTRPIHLSEMDIGQASKFIYNILGLIIEYGNLTQSQEVDVRKIFEEFQEHSNTGDNNPIDFDDNGEYYSVDEWCEHNNVSMASGVNDGTLEIAHIISKGAHPEYRGCVWNFLRLTHYEHLEIQHKKGWKEFLGLYPHLLPRVKAAYDQAHEHYPWTMVDEFNAQETNFDNMADLALSLAKKK